MEHDPVGVAKLLDIKLNRKYDLDRNGANPASSAQLACSGASESKPPRDLSKWGASKMIKNLLKRKERGEASAIQVQSLMASGVDADIARSM